MGDGSGLSAAGLERMRGALAARVEQGDVSGLVALVHRRGETHAVTAGTMSLGGAPMRRDAIFRLASLTKLVTAVTALTLVEECRIRLDDPVDDLLPELADRRVLRSVDAPIGDTVPAERPISVRDLLTFRMGIGLVMAPPGAYPIQQAMAEAGFAPGPDGPAISSGDEWIKRLGSLPLVHQPGTTWMYHTSADVLGVLIARATGRPFEDVCRERVLAPLGMGGTGFQVPDAGLARMPVSYIPDLTTGELTVRPEPHVPWDRHPGFVSGGGGRGLAGTADDYLAFCRMLLNDGRHPGGRILSRPAVRAMATDQLTPEQKAGNEIFFGPGGGWGFGVQVNGLRDDLSASPGRFGWTGGLGTLAFVDPAEEMVTILFTQTAMTSPKAPRVFLDFLTGAYAAIDD